MPVSGATFVYHGGTISGSLVLTGATLELAAPAATPDTIVLTGSNSLAGDVPAGHTLRITDDFTGGSVLTSATGFTNHGSIVFETSVGYGGNLTILSGALSNAADGHVSVNQGVGGPATISGQVVNDGTVAIASGATLTVAGGYAQAIHRRA